MESRISINLKSCYSEMINVLKNFLIFLKEVKPKHLSIKE